MNDNSSMPAVDPDVTVIDPHSDRKRQAAASFGLMWRNQLRRWTLTVLIAALLASISQVGRCDEVGLGGAANQVKLLDVDGRTISGRLKSLDAAGITFEVKPAQTYSLRNLISIIWPENRLQPRESEPVLILANGDLLGLRPEQANEEILVGRWSRYPGWSPLTVPMEWVRGALLLPPRDRDGRFRMLEQLSTNSLRSDLLLLQNGDMVKGQWQGLKDRKISLKTATGVSEFDVAGVQGFSGNPELIVQPPSDASAKGAARILCRLTDGSTFTLKSIRLKDGDKFIGSLACGPEIQISASAISGLWFSGERVTYLSDLKPQSYKFTPYLSQEWSPRTDRTVQGGPLRLRGVEYPRGIGVHSRSEVAYRLEGRYRRFQATIGIDDDTAGKGSATFEVLVDGKSAYKSPVLTGTSAAVSIPAVNVADARSLTLIVDFATQGDIQDHANWCQALLVN